MYSFKDQLRATSRPGISELHGLYPDQGSLERRWSTRLVNFDDKQVVSFRSLFCKESKTRKITRN